MEAETKKSEKELWKFRNLKKSSKYIPDDMDDAENKVNEGWLSKDIQLSLRIMPTNHSETI